MATATRERILDAALEAFATTGLEGTPITDLEDAAGLAPGSGGFYRYFRTKEEALAALLARETERARDLQAAAPAPAETGDHHADVTAVLRSMLDTMQRLRRLMAIIARHAGRIPPAAAAAAEELFEVGLADDIARLAALLERDPDELHATVVVVLTAMVGHAPLDVEEPDYLDALATLLIG